MKMSGVGFNSAEFTTASDGLLELSPELMRSLLRTEPIRDVYHVEETPFARGKFASVKKVRHLETGREYAAKVVRKRRRDAAREIQHEVAVLALCAGTPRVVRLHEVYDARTEVYIVLELASGGELQRVLDAEERLTERAARRALAHVLEGLAHLHARRVAHLDLKPQNLLLDADTGDLCICDFGISRAIRPGAVVREILGTRDYVAPEILSYEPISLAADVWSVGVLAYVLLSGYSPFAGATKQETYLNIAQCSLTFPDELFADVSERAIAFVRDTLVLDPEGRLTVEQCLEHPWLQDVESPARPLAPPLADQTGADTGDTSDTGETDDTNDTDRTTNGINGHQTNGTTEDPARGTSDSDTHGLNGYESSKFNGRERSPRPPAPAPAEHEHKQLKHAHECSPPPPFPPAPSTPKVSRKSSPSCVRALCKKFQPDYGERAPLEPLPLADNKPCGCGFHPCRRHPRPPLPPDRAILC